MEIILQFVNSNENNLIYFLLTNGKEEQWIVSELFIRASCSRLRSFVHHIVVDVKFKFYIYYYVVYLIRSSRKTVCANEIQPFYRVM